MSRNRYAEVRKQFSGRLVGWAKDNAGHYDDVAEFQMAVLAHAQELITEIGHYLPSPRDRVAIVEWAARTGWSERDVGEAELDGLTGEQRAFLNQLRD